MSNRLRYVLGSIVGAIIIHLVLINCSGEPSGLLDGARLLDSGQTADAATSEAACAQWEVKAFLPTGFTFKELTYQNSDGTSGNVDIPVPSPFQLPEGWEPFAGEGYGVTLARHCVR